MRSDQIQINEYYAIGNKKYTECAPYFLDKAKVLSLNKARKVAKVKFIDSGQIKDTATRLIIKTWSENETAIKLAREKEKRTLAAKAKKDHYRRIESDIGRRIGEILNADVLVRAKFDHKTNNIQIHEMSICQSCKGEQSIADSLSYLGINIDLLKQEYDLEPPKNTDF